MFGSVNEGTISNLTLLSGSVSPHDSCRNVGSLIGEFNGGTVTNIISYVDIDDTESSITYIGGIVGSMSNASAYKCMNFGNINITHPSECIGGIAGCAYDFSSTARNATASSRPWVWHGWSPTNPSGDA